MDPAVTTAGIRLIFKYMLISKSRGEDRGIHKAEPDWFCEDVLKLQLQGTRILQAQ